MNPATGDAIASVLALAVLPWAAAGLAATRPGWVIDRARPVLVLLGLASLLALATLVRLDPPGVRLGLDPSTEPLLPRGDPARAIHERAIRAFGDDELYVVAAECADVFEPGCLEEVDAVARALVRIEGVQRVTSLLSATSFRYDAEQDWIEVRDFIETIPRDAASLAALRERALRDPIYRRTLVSPDGRTTALEVRLHPMTDAERLEHDLDGRVEAVLRDREARGATARFRLSGRPHFKAHVYRGMVRDLSALIPLAVVGIAAVLAVFHGNVRGVVLPLGTGLGSVLWTFAAMAWLGRPMSIVTVLVGPMLLAIGSVHALHVVARFEEEAPDASSAREAAGRTLGAQRGPLVIAATTTALGFAALLVSDVPAVRELGVFSVLGTGVIALLALAGVPAALALLPLRVRRTRFAAHASRRLERALLAVSSRVVRHTRAALAVFALAAVAAVLAIPSIEIDTDYLSYLDDDDPVRRDFDAINAALSGAVPLFVVVDLANTPTQGDAGAALREPETLRALERLQHAIEQIDGVGRVVTFLDALKVLGRAFARDDPAHERLPDSRAAAAELLFLVPKTDLARHATLDHETANLVARIGVVGSAAVRRVVADIEAAVRAADLPGGASVSVTGNALLLARSADGLARAQPLSVAVAALAILTFVAVGLRAPRLGVLAMLPNLVPVLLFFGLLGLGAAPLSLPTGLIGAVALGIAVDDTVHLVVRYRYERAAGRDRERAVGETVRTVGRPVAITTAMLSVAFGVIALSQFATLREFGVLTAVTMGLCLATDLVLLPALLLRSRD